MDIEPTVPEATFRQDVTAAGLDVFFDWTSRSLNREGIQLALTAFQAVKTACDAQAWAFPEALAEKEKRDILDVEITRAVPELRAASESVRVFFLVSGGSLTEMRAPPWLTAWIAPCAIADEKRNDLRGAVFAARVRGPEAIATIQKFPPLCAVRCNCKQPGCLRPVAIVVGAAASESSVAVLCASHPDALQTPDVARLPEELEVVGYHLGVTPDVVAEELVALEKRSKDTGALALEVIRKNREKIDRLLVGIGGDVVLVLAHKEPNVVVRASRERLVSRFGGSGVDIQLGAAPDIGSAHVVVIADFWTAVTTVALPPSGIAAKA